VSNDQRETARAAARELLATGHANFAYVNAVERKKWCELRERGFAEALAIHGKMCAVYRADARSGEGIKWMKGLRRFISAVKKPCAVFAANDKTAEAVISAAALEGFDIPGDIAVVGVDNYVPICEHVTPHLSSIEPDFRRGGRLAATMLLGLAMSKGKWHGGRVQTFGPLRTVHRASTRVLSIPDKTVSDALDLIRREACNGLQAVRVARLFPCSRRQADNRFRRATGRSILEEIHAVQLERAKELLRDTSVQLKAISDFCGFTNPNSLRKFFLKATGMTMTAWRDTSARVEVSY
jgi:LacI family transcriptional regulator